MFNRYILVYWLLFLRLGEGSFTVTGLLVKCVLHLVVPTYVAAAKTGRVRSKNGTGKWVEEEEPNFFGGKLFFSSLRRPALWMGGGV